MLFADLFIMLLALTIMCIYVVFLGFILIALGALLRGLFLKIMKWFNKKYSIKEL